MADRRPGAEDYARSKRQKVSDTDPSSNPYLAHMYPDEAADDGYSNGYGAKLKPTANGDGPSDGLKSLKRHATTTAQATKAENGPANPFNGKNLSERYFGILKTRRNLPVHAQRYEKTLYNYLAGRILTRH